jgi:5-methylcytosine-specific restriction endonuclease McrA
MEVMFNLKIKKDQVLISELKELVTTERKTLTQILHYLREIEIRRLYLVRGYPSLFAMLTQELGYSESAAGRRIQAMRLIQELPEVEIKIEKGAISLSVASQMASFINNENKRRQVEKSPKLSLEEKLSLVDKLAGSSTQQCEKLLLEISPEAALPKEKTKPISSNKTLIQFVADEGLMKDIERLKTLMSHKNPTGKLEPLFSDLVKIALDKLDPERRELRRNQRKGKLIQKSTELPPTSVVKKSSRNIPRALRDKIWLRDQGHCQYREPKSGKLCGSKHRIQLDHRYPFSLGGEHSEENLRLRCFKHNQFHAVQSLGEFPIQA